MNLPHRRAASISIVRCASLVLATAPVFLPGTVTAQQEDAQAVQRQPLPGTVPAQQEDAQAAPRQPSLWLEPRVSVQHTVTSNARLDATNISDQVTEVIPGFRLVSNMARIKGFVDYSLHGAYYARDSGFNHIWHNLNARAVVEAIEQRAFIELAGVVASQPISAFGAPVNGSPANPNNSQTSSFRLSPYLRGNIGATVDYEARYSVQDTRTNADNRADVMTQDWLLRLGSRKSGQIVGWSVDASHQTADFSLGRSIETATLRARVSYAVSPHLILAGIGGAESTNQISPTRESHRITGVGAIWQPSERTRLSFERESRYFGEAHNVALEHRTGRTVWRYTDTRGISNGLGAQSASLGSLFDLLDGFYTRFEPDPIRRTQLVLAEIERLGSTANVQVLQDFLRSSSTLQRLQQLSLALLGQRSMVTLAVSRSDNRLIGDTLQLGDDFDTNNRIRQRGWNLLLAHRLTPNSSIHANFGEQRAIGTVPGLETRVRSIVLGWNVLLARRTSGGIQIRRVLSDGQASPFSESAIVGIITHRF